MLQTQTAQSTPEPRTPIAGKIVVRRRRAAEMLDMSLPTLDGLLKAKQLDAYMDGSVKKITIESIHRYIAGKLAGAQPKAA